MINGQMSFGFGEVSFGNFVQGKIQNPKDNKFADKSDEELKEGLNLFMSVADFNKAQEISEELKKREAEHKEQQVFGKIGQTQNNSTNFNVKINYNEKSIFE